MQDNTVICAIASPPGQGAIAVIRISGKGSIELTDTIFKSPSSKKLIQMKPNTIHYGEIYEGENTIDEVLISIFRAPHSYTGEDSIEISCHGSVYIQQRILQLLVKKGARLADPGEFTQRSFLNGKLDLSQAEAVADLISSSSEASHRMAMNQMKGGFSTELIHLREELLKLTSLLELELDFSEEDVEFAERSELEKIGQHLNTVINRLINSFSLGNVIKNGIPVAIVGDTNVGKSTLLNSLLQEEKAIVSDIAGTTRDYIEDNIVLNGLNFRFIDTAGIRNTEDKIETLGIERTFSKIRQAEIILFLADATSDINQISSYYKRIYKEKNEFSTLLIVLNKIDLVKDMEKLETSIRNITKEKNIVPISAKKGINLSLLTEKLTSIISFDKYAQEDVIINNVRHFEALSNAGKAIERVIEGINSGISGEFISQDIRECLHYLGEITGEISTDEILGNIFKNFCIGK